MPEILLLQSEPRTFPLLKRTLESHFRCGEVSHMEEIPTLLPACGPAALVLHSSPPVPLSTLRRLRREHPSLALVMAGDFSGREMDLYHLGRSRVDGVIRLETHPEPREILKVLEGAIASCLANVVVGSVTPDLPPLAQEALRWAVENAESSPRVSDLAAALALTPSGLSRELRVRGLAPPRALLLWGRLLKASHLLEREGETVESVAFSIGYATAGTLGRALKRHVGLGPTALLRHGGLQWTLKAFQRWGLRRSGGTRNRWTNARSSRWPTRIRTRNVT